MDFFLDEQAIIACSTSLVAPSAIALIRISGFKNLLALQEFFSFDLAKARPRCSHFSSILDNKNKLDEGLFVFFPAPKSYTGENLLEISVHGNPLNVARIVNVFSASKKMRAAREGEFTYRALRNKKLTLSQVEGLDLVLNASSSQAFDQGLSLMHGQLHAEYLLLRDVFLKLKASVELSIDFLEDVGEEQADDHFKTYLGQFGALLNALHARTQSSHSDLLSPSLVLAGQTNAGKSSVFNAILKNKRSIVSPTAGTTRDFVSEYFYLDGVNFKLVDTAGLRLTQDQIEQEGIERSLDLFQKAFFRILVINPLETNEKDFEPLFTHFKKEELDLIILTHADCAGFRESWSKFDKQFSSFTPRLELALAGSIEPLRKINLVSELVLAKFNALYKKNPIIVDRHRELIHKVHSLTEEFVILSSSTNDVAIIASQLNVIGSALDELIGIISSHEVMDSIFSRFCIGK